ncbi:MAG: sigma 54-interacting transcriptional regulator [Bacteroidetes bacterium]|nr:sigma 54-interacting transcriptional regulator [Bacteroidota bacterium]
MNSKINIQKNIIKKSHKRSEEYGIRKNQVFPSKILKGKEVSSNLVINEYLLRIANPFIGIIYKIVANSGFFILLTDYEGCIISSVGDSEIITESERLNMVVGAYMNERSIGTNAMGTAICENQAIQVTASEHFLSAYHRWTCSAAPIHNEEGTIIGTLNLTGESHLVHTHTLGLVIAAVMAIENQIKAEQTQYKLNETLSHMESIIEADPSGILSLDIDGKVKKLNNWACSMLNLEKEKSIDISIDKYIPQWRDILEHFQKGENYLDMETTISLKGIKKSYNLNAYPIVDNKDTIIGIVLSLKGIQKIFNLVNKYAVMSALYTFDDIIGDSTNFIQVIRYAENISNSPSTVLLLGESGTGKELIAQSIHNASYRRNSVFIAVNCGALPKNLIESELFGYAEGAFTGSKKGGHVGKFELANGGTILLDEIGEMPLDLQVTLLRVLQEGYITRIGGNKNIPVDVRIIAATKKNLFEEVKKGTFREDLFYRLSVIPILIPPLRERGNDRISLFNHFLKIKAQKLDKPIPVISQDILNKVIEYNWPGNVRELENFVENIVNFNGKSSFNITNSITGIEYFQNQESCQQKKQINDNANEEIFYMTLEENEKQTIKTCLKHLDGNITKASNKLGICRTTLYSKMKKYNLL